MIRLNLAAAQPCPTCGAQVIETFDGGKDMPIVYCDRARTVLRGPALRAWWDEHAKHCKGCDGRDGPAVWTCDFESTPQWLTDGRLGITPPRTAFDIRTPDDGSQPIR